MLFDSAKVRFLLFHLSKSLYISLSIVSYYIFSDEFVMQRYIFSDEYQEEKYIFLTNTSN